MSKQANFGNLYEFNKMAYGKVSAIPANKAREKYVEIGNWFNATHGVDAYDTCGNPYNHHYQMLLCRELADYTVFVNISTIGGEGAVMDLEDIINHRGTLLDILYNSDSDAYEIWVRTKQDGEVHMYMLFRCNDFIVEY